MWTQYRFNSGNSITLSALWPGDSGTVSWLIASDQNWATIGKSNDDPLLKENWSCTYNGPSQITLQRPWDGPTDNSRSYHLYYSNLAGYGQQTFMLGGYKSLALKWSSLVSDPTLSHNFAALTPLAAQWVHDVGYDSEIQGMSYGRIFQACEPRLFLSTVPASWKATGCQTGSDPASARAARVLNAETSQAIRVYLETNNYSAQAKDFGDRVYGSIWGYCPYTASGFYCDGNYVRDENSDASLGAYKWPGFFFGIGMSHMWPAVRVGGPQPPRNRTIDVSFNIGSAASARIVLTAPNGISSTVSCSASPCAVTVDDRQGRYLYKIQYLSGSGSVLSQTDPDLLPGTP